MSYTSFKQAILLLAASEALLSEKSEIKEYLQAAYEIDSGAEVQVPKD